MNINGIVFNFKSHLVYRKAIDFYLLASYPENWPQSLGRSSTFWSPSFRFSAETIPPHLQSARALADVTKPPQSSLGPWKINLQAFFELSCLCKIIRFYSWLTERQT